MDLLYVYGKILTNIKVRGSLPMKEITRLQIFRLYETHKKPMIKLAKRKISNIAVAEDVVQDAFEKLILYLETKDNTLDDDHLEALIILFVKQLLIDEYRKQTTRKNVLYVEGRDAPIDDAFEKMIVDRQSAKQLYQELESELEREDLDMATLKYGYELTSKELAEKYRINANAVNQRLFKFRQRAKQILGVHHE